MALVGVLTVAAACPGQSICLRTTIMTEIDKQEKPDYPPVKVHILPHRIYADPEEIMNHPKTKEQIEQIRELMERERKRKAALRRQNGAGNEPE